MGKTLFDILFVINFFVSARNTPFDVHFQRIRLLHYPPKGGKDAAYEGRNAWKGVHFRPESAFFVFILILIKVLFPICTLTWRVSNYVSRQGKGINRRKESTILIMITVWLLYTTVQTSLNNFVGLDWLSLIENNFSSWKEKHVFRWTQELSWKIQNNSVFTAV